MNGAPKPGFSSGQSLAAMERVSAATLPAGYTFEWKGISRGLGTTTSIKTFRMEEIESDRIEGQIAYDHKAVATDMGYFFSGAVS